MRRSFATPLIKLAFPFSSTSPSCSLTRLGRLKEMTEPVALLPVAGSAPRFLRLVTCSKPAPTPHRISDVLIPIAVQHRLQAAPTDQLCSCLLRDFDQISLLLISHHAQNLISARALPNCRCLRLGPLPILGCCLMLRVKPVIRTPGCGWPARWSVQ